MTNMRKFTTALVLGLVMCLALLTTGAFAQSAHGGYGGYGNIGFVSANSVAIAGGDEGGFGDFGGCGCGCGGFGGGAFAHANVDIFGFDGGFGY